MFIIISLCYALFAISVIFPPTEFVTAGFTITHFFENLLGSENRNFILFHMKRITLTVFIHSLLPLGYIICLWLGGVTSSYLFSAAILSGIIPLLAVAIINHWWHNYSKNHPVPRALTPFATEGGDWRIVAANINSEFGEYVF